MKNRIYELIAILLILLTSACLSYFIISCIDEPKTMSQNFAQILAEIIAFIFVLPQVIIQLALKPHQKDVKTVFAGCIPIYFIYYVLALLCLALNIFDLIQNQEIKRFAVLFTFISSIMLLLPYFYFLINEYSTSLSMFVRKRNQIIKKLKNLSKLNQEFRDENTNNEKDLKKPQREILDAVMELRDYVLTYGEQSLIFFSTGINALTESVELPYQSDIADIDNMLLEILDIITYVGLKVENDASKNIIIERVTELATNILSAKEEAKNQRINVFVTRIITLLEKMTINGTTAVSSETIETLLKKINDLIKISLRRTPPKELEFHLVAESYKRLCLHSIDKLYMMCARDAVEYISYMSIQSMKKMPSKASVDKMCDVLKEIGVLAAKGQNEIFCILCMNRIIQIIDELKNKKDPVNQIEECMASLLEFSAYCWLYFPRMEDWLYARLNQMKREIKLPYKKYIPSTKRILKLQSNISSAIFADFIDNIDRK
ncbi:hypothetical protein JXB12_00735 [candidate division KSB1 bacterium]|nr:hypothetical protein [candidate division KSB1 bacterium]